MAVGGDMAEGAVASELIRLGCAVLFPFGQGQPYDLVVDRGEGGFLRIQVKTGWERDGCVLFNRCSTGHGRGRQDYRGKVDLPGVSAAALQRVFIVPVERAATRVTRLRLRPPANNQARRINPAEDFDLERYAHSLRPVPQATGAVAA